MARLMSCQARNCNNSFIPKAGAKRAMYCSPKCRQRAYNDRLRAKREAQSRTLSIDEAIYFKAIADKMPALDNALDTYEKLYGSPATMGTVKLIAAISQALGFGEPQP